MHLDDADFTTLLVEDQRGLTLLQRWIIETEPRAEPLKPKINLDCIFFPDKINRVEVVFFDKRKNYFLDFKCSVFNED